jgi:hypothetical protein
MTPSLLFLAVSFKSELTNWRYFGVKFFGMGRDITGLCEQNRVLAVDTIVLFYAQNDPLGQLA